MKTVRIAAAQTPEFREDLDGVLAFAIDLAARGAALLCIPEGFLQGYLTEETLARRHALDWPRQASRRCWTASPRPLRRERTF